MSGNSLIRIRFDVGREANAHVAFGLKSPHKCLGEHLARWEIKVLFEELLPLVKSIELAGRWSACGRILFQGLSICRCGWSGCRRGKGRNRPQGLYREKGKAEGGSNRERQFGNKSYRLRDSDYEESIGCFECVYARE